MLWGLSACGIESYAYLTAPSLNSQFSPGTPEASFYHNGSDVDILVFRGYQLYYKFYPVIATPDSSLDEYSKLAANGFLRMYSSKDSTDSDPSMSSIRNVLVNLELADRNRSFSVYLSFWKNDLTYGDEPYLTIYSFDTGFSSSQTIMLRRSVTDSSTGFCKSFREITSTDADILTLYNQYLTSSIQVAFYAVTYGIQDVTTAVYSVPVFLGAVTIP